MKNKTLINKLKDNAELAMAAYGYFHLIGKKIENDREKYGDKADKPITLHDILDSTYKGYVTSDHTTLINPEELDGDFSPTQTQRFFERYDLLKHCPNTDSGFSATLFREKRKQRNTESKEISYTSEYGYINYILAIRGTEPLNRGDIGADTSLILRNLPKKQHLDMLLFYNQCNKKYSFLCRKRF
ncbi:hypothetical protein [Helicobacter trogontum]|uniref:hypothetical protein n=1 Tax=Helicobacter trogontum TaxID=50960 RepID=UPI000AECF53E|nr:hypothetical protein [Helicobacter trogontum]